MALQNSFYHWNTHQQKYHFYTIQSAILEICLSKTVLPTGDALNASTKMGGEGQQPQLYSKTETETEAECRELST